MNTERTEIIIMQRFYSEKDSVLEFMKSTLEGLGQALEGAGNLAWQASKLNYFADTLFEFSRGLNKMAVQLDEYKNRIKEASAGSEDIPNVTK
jgi:hypothetical protein